MNLSPLIKRTVLIAVALVLEKIDKKITEERNRSYEEYLSRKRTQKPLEAPKMNSPTKYTRGRYKPSIDDPKPVYANGIFKLTIDDNGIITSMSSRPSKYITATTKQSKYTPEQLQSFYKINPYTNL